MRIQLLTYDGCPIAPAARERLRRVVESLGIVPAIEEIDTAAPGTPDGLRDWGSPTILIDGVDIEGRETPTGAGCRLYRDADGVVSGVPTEATLRPPLLGDSKPSSSM